MKRWFGAGAAVAAAVALVVGIRLALAACFPLIQDEAYYFAWTRHWDWGYFDHPPLVAYLSAGHRWFARNLFAARAGGALLAIGMLPVLWRALAVSGVRGVRQRGAALVAANMSLAGLLFGVLATPDFPQCVAWLVALHEAAVALRRDPRRWVTAGIATGLGLWGKYTMLLIGPIFLWALLRRKGALRSPWPYLGGIACLVVFLPHLWWNHDNDWITFRFQFRHGFAGDHAVEGVSADALPRPVDAVNGTREEKLGRYFISAAEEKEREAERRPPRSELEKAWMRLGDYLGAQVVLWGFILVPVGMMAFRRRGKRAGDAAREAEPVDDGEAWRDTKPLWVAATVFPLGFFLLVSLKANVEANWAAPYLFGATVLLSAWRTWPWRAVLGAGLANAALAFAVAWHAHSPFPTRKPHRDRILVETSGYPSLAAHARTLDAPVFADSYQLVAEMMYWEPDLTVAQWPGVTRTSEFTRRSGFAPWGLADVKAKGAFWLITTQEFPPMFPGFEAQRMVEARDCPGEPLAFAEAFAAPVYMPPCAPYAHRWFMVRYRTRA